MRTSTSWPYIPVLAVRGESHQDGQEEKIPNSNENEEDEEFSMTLSNSQDADKDVRPPCCEQVCLTSIYMAASVGMGVLMKFMFSSVLLPRSHDSVLIRGLPAPFLWTATQQFVGFVLALVMVLLHYISRGRLGYCPPIVDSAQEYVQIVMLASLFTLNIGLNNFSLSLVSLTVNNIIRATNPFWTATAAAMLNGNKVPFEQWVLLCLGVAFAVMTVLLSGQDKLFSGGSFSVGVGVALCSILCGGITLVVVERLGKSASKLNAIDSACYMTLPSGLLLLFGVTYLDHVVPSGWANGKAGLRYTDLEIFGLVNSSPVWPLFVLSGLCAFAYNVLQFLLVQRLSPVYTAFASNLSKAVTVVVSELYLEAAATSVQCFLVIAASFCVVVSFTLFSVFSLQSTIPGERGVVRKVRWEMRQREVRRTLLLVLLAVVAGILAGLAMAVCWMGLGRAQAALPHFCNPVTFPQSQPIHVDDAFYFGSLHDVVGRDGVLFITPESEPRRYQRAAKVLGEAGILPTQFPATEKDCASPEELKLACWHESNLHASKWCHKRGKVGTGCASKLEQAKTDSHRRALLAALQRDHEWTAILEDDAAPIEPHSWDSHFKISWPRIPAETKLVRLSWCSVGNTIDDIFDDMDEDRDEKYSVEEARLLSSSPPVAGRIVEAESWIPALQATKAWCRNAPQISIGHHSTELDVAGCSMRCQNTRGCVGFGYAARSPCQGGASKGDCYLWSGSCMYDSNSCIDEYSMQKVVNRTYERTSPMETRHKEGRSRHKDGRKDGWTHHKDARIHHEVGFRLERWNGDKEHKDKGGSCAAGYIVHRSIIRQLLSLFPCCCSVDLCYERQLFNSNVSPNVTWGRAYMISMDVRRSLDESGEHSLKHRGILVSNAE